MEHKLAILLPVSGVDFYIDPSAITFFLKENPHPVDELAGRLEDISIRYRSGFPGNDPAHVLQSDMHLLEGLSELFKDFISLHPPAGS